MTWEAQKMHLKIFGRNSLCPGGGGGGGGGGPKMKNAQNDMGSLCSGTINRELHSYCLLELPSC